MVKIVACVWVWDLGFLPVWPRSTPAAPARVYAYRIYTVYIRRRPAHVVADKHVCLFAICVSSIYFRGGEEGLDVC